MRFAIWERSRKVVNLSINIKVKFTIGAVDCWNKTQNTLRNQSLKSLYPNKIKTILTKRCIDKY